MDFSSTGKGLSVAVCCKPIPAHLWMSFVCWYSFKKNLPDAGVQIFCERQESFLQFNWAKRLRVKLKYGSPEKSKNGIIYIEPQTLAIRPYVGLLGPVSSKNDVCASLIDYSDGCGNFVMSSWIHKVNGNPLPMAVKRFATENMTANELRVLRFFESSEAIYKAVA
jgi:hypothetical protein